MTLSAIFLTALAPANLLSRWFSRTALARMARAVSASFITLSHVGTAGVTRRNSSLRLKRGSPAGSVVILAFAITNMSVIQATRFLLWRVLRAVQQAVGDHSPMHFLLQILLHTVAVKIVALGVRVIETSPAPFRTRDAPVLGQQSISARGP